MECLPTSYTLAALRMPAALVTVCGVRSVSAEDLPRVGRMHSCRDVSKLSVPKLAVLRAFFRNGFLVTDRYVHGQTSLLGISGRVGYFKIAPRDRSQDRVYRTLWSTDS